MDEFLKEEQADQKPDIDALKIEINGHSPDLSNCETTNDDVSPLCPFSNQSVEDVRKFHILDETEDSDSDKSMSYDSDIPDEEIDKMLEDALASKKRKAADADLGKISVMLGEVIVW